MSNYIVRQFKNSDYPTLCEWVNAWDWDDIPQPTISPYSYIVEFKGEPVLYTSFYKYEGCPLATMGFTISNPECSKLVAGKAISKGLDHIFDVAGTMGITALRYITDEDSMVMVNFFKKKGGIPEITGNGHTIIKHFTDDKLGFLHY